MPREDVATAAPETIVGSLEDLRQEATRLRVERAKLAQQTQEVDADGTPSANSFIAARRLPQVDDDYRQVLTAIASKETAATPEARAKAKADASRAQSEADLSALEAANYLSPQERADLAIATAQASRAPQKTPEQIYQEEKAKIKAQRENFEWRASQGYEPTPEETEAFRAATLKSLETIRQANALALQAQQDADARALAGEQSRLRVQEFETTEKPYKEEDLRLKREASDLARGQAQAGVLAKQAEAGQEMVKSMVGWAAPSIETVKAAYSPLQAALRILNSGTRTATAPPSVTAPPPIQPAPNRV